MCKDMYPARWRCLPCDRDDNRTRFSFLDKLDGGKNPESPHILGYQVSVVEGHPGHAEVVDHKLVFHLLVHVRSAQDLIFRLRVELGSVQKCQPLDGHSLEQQLH